MKTKGRFLSLVLAFFMLASMLSVLPPLEVIAARSDCVICPGCNVTCSFSPSRSMYWGETLEFSGKITSDNTIQKVTVKAFDIDNPDKYVFQIFTNQSVNSKTFYLNNVPDFIAGENLSENWDGVTIVIYVVSEGETGVLHQFEYDINFKDLASPNISAPDEDDTFYAGDDITFTWGSVSGAEEFEWEFYEGIKSSGRLLDSDTTGTLSSSRKAVIDGDSLQAGKAYSFYVRATNDYSLSDWEWLNFYVYAKPWELFAYQEELSFSKDGGKDYIDLISSHEWTATVSDSWIKLSDESGTGDEEITVTVSANTGASRVGVITFQSDVGSITVIVSQAKGETSRLDVDKTNIQTSCEEGYESFSVTSNLYNWKVSSDVDWLGVTSSGLDLNDTVKISVDENKSTESRTGTITVTGDGITRTVTVTQEGKPHECAFGGWEAVDAENHKRVCACGEEETESHSYDEGVVTIEPKHEIPGERTFTCTECGYSYTEEIAAEEHAFGEWEAVDAESHKRVCACGEEEIEEHKWDNGSTVNITEIVYICQDCNEQKIVKSETDHISGDIDGDGEFSIEDANIFMRYIAKQDVDVNEVALDINGDGKINNKDVIRLMQYQAGWDVEIL